MSNKILTNQTNLTSTFYTGSIGHDVSTGVEFTRETQTNYGVNPVTLPAVNIYHPDSSIHPGGLTRNGANANGQTDTFAIYAFDTLQITRDFELNGGSVWIIIILNMTVPPPAAAADAVPSPAQLVWQRFSVTTVDTAKSGNLVNWKAGALYHLTENGNVYINYAVSQQPPGGNNFALAQSGSGNSANRTDFKPQKPTPARLAPNGRFWINVCCSPPRCSVLISKMKLSKMMTELTRNTVRNASKAMRYPWPGISLPRGR